MQIGNVNSAQLYTGGNIRATDVAGLKVLLEGCEGSLNNYRLFHSVNGPDAPLGFEAPRHRHNFEQFRLPLRGDFDYAPGKILPQGWVGYFPEGVHYGPQSRQPDLVLLTLQFGGPSRSGYMSSAERRAGFEALNRRGKFTKGAFTWIDDNGQRHNQDAFEAVWEEWKGRKLVYPTPRYNDHIFMNPEAFGWAPDPNAPGVSRKPLGTFTEAGVHTAFVRLEPGAEFRLGSGSAIEVLYVIKGKLSNSQHSIPADSALSCDCNEPQEVLKAVEQSECVLFRLPVFD